MANRKHAATSISPEDRPSLLDTLFFSWSPFHRAAVPDTIQLQDLPDVAHHTQAQTLAQRFKSKKGNGSLWKQLALTFTTPLLQQLLLVLFKALSQFGGVVILHRLLQQLEGHSAPSHGSSPWVFVLGFGLALMLETIMVNWLTWVTQMRLQMPIIALLNTLLFEKNMRKQLMHEESSRQVKDGKDKSQHLLPSSLTDMISNDRCVRSDSCTRHC